MDIFVNDVNCCDVTTADIDFTIQEKHVNTADYANNKDNSNVGIDFVWYCLELVGQATF